MSKNDVCSVDNMTVLKREEYLAALIAAYEMFAFDAQDKFLSGDLTPRDMSAGFDGDPGYWWCRHMVPKGKLTGRGMFCIANVRVPESIRGKGVFGEFLDYVISNPHYFTGVEVEAIFNDHLIEYLKGRGFVNFRENAWGRPTLRYTFKEH